MNNNQYSTNISTSITNHILRKAAKAHFQKVKNRKLNEQSKVVASEYPTQCTSQIISFFNLAPFQQHPLGIGGVNVTPRSPTNKLHFNYTSAISTPAIFPHMRSTKQTERMKSRGSHQPFENRCVKIQFQKEEDEQIQMLRTKKQKIYELENIFKESQRKQKAKSRIAKSKHVTYITDFNGQNIEMKPIKKKHFADSYFRAEVNVAGFRQQRAQHHRVPTQESFKSKDKGKNRSFKFLLPSKKLLTGDYAKQEGPSQISQNLPFRENQFSSKRKVKVRQSWKDSTGDIIPLLEL